MPTAPLDRAQNALAALQSLTSAKVGISAVHLESGLSLQLNADDMYPMASTVKVAVAILVLEMESSGDIAANEMVTVEQEDISIEYPEVVWGGHPGASFSIANLIEMMMTRSDNTATDTLLKRIGGMRAVRSFLAKLGLKVGSLEDGGEINPVSNTKLFLQRSYPELFDEFDPTPVTIKYANLEKGKPKLAQKYQDSLLPPNPTALDHHPRDKAKPTAMTTLLAKVFACDGISEYTKSKLLPVMSRCMDTRRFRAAFPSYIIAGNKTGTIRGCQNDVGWDFFAFLISFIGFLTSSILRLRFLDF